MKGDPVDDLDTPMREFMEWEGCPQSFNQETGYTIGERSWTATAFILSYEKYKEEWDFKFMAQM